MKHVTTNIRLPEDLWKSLKLEAAHRGVRLSEIIRERLWFKPKTDPKKSLKSLRGAWKSAKISDQIIQEAKQALFKNSPEKLAK